jgi:hypothetical protein
MLLGDHVNVLLIFSALCLALFTYIVYYVHKQMKKDDQEIHQLAAARLAEHSRNQKN